MRDEDDAEMLAMITGILAIIGSSLGLGASAFMLTVGDYGIIDAFAVVLACTAAAPAVVYGCLGLLALYERMTR